MKLKSTFSKNVLILFSGAGIAQLLLVLITPWLTRLYSPEEFGVFLMFLAIIGIIQPAVTGRYDKAIILPGIEKNAVNIIVLIGIISTILSLFIYVLIILAPKYLSILFFDSQQYKKLLFIIPPTLVLYALNQSLIQWLVRKGQYKNITLARVIRSLGIAVGQIGLSQFNLHSYGLILGFMVGEVLIFVFLYRLFMQQIKGLIYTISKVRIVALARKYKDFPKFDVISCVFNQASHQMPIIFLGAFISIEVAGLYGLTQRVLATPIGLISTSIVDVFKKTANTNYRNTGSCRSDYVQLFGILLKLSILPFIILFVWGEGLFAFVFGDEWRYSGYYAQILSLALFIRFISNPLSAMFHIAEKQKYNLYGNILLFISTLVFGMHLMIFRSVIDALILFTIINFCIYIWYIYFSYRITENRS
ncbi:MAG: oligosaccharide flippase family protein [Gammaproteobacteria bacterium]|nr:oligosaccharide flippase family protein [Gammaproteobacteria bacterium]